MSLHLSILGSGQSPVPAGWTRETAISLIGSSRIDLSGSSPGSGATLTGISVVGSMEIVVPAGNRLSVGGFSLLGSRKVRVTPGEGSLVRLRLFSLLGSITVVDDPSGKADL